MRLLPAIFLAATLPWAGSLERIARDFETRSLRIDLEWTRTPPPGLGDPVQASGVLRIAPGNRFHFRSGALTLVSDGTTFWQYLPATHQVLIQKLSKIDPSLLPMGLLQGALKAKEVSARDEVHDGRNLHRIELKASTPPLSRYPKVVLWTESVRPAELEAQDDQGGRTVWKLRSLKDFEPKPETFVFRIPAGTSVVDTRQ